MVGNITKKINEKINEHPLTYGGLILISGFFVPLIFWGLLVAFITSIIVVPIVLYFIFAPNKIFAVFPDEAYAVAIMEGGAFYDLYIKYRGKGLTEDYDVVDLDNEGNPKSIHTSKGDKQAIIENRRGKYFYKYEEVIIERGIERNIEKEVEIKMRRKPKSYFGMIIIPLWPLRRVFNYNLKWTKLDKNGNKESREESLWQIMLMRYAYYIETLKVETKNKTPVNMGLVIEAQVTNPYKAIFVNKDWVSIMEFLFLDAVRDFINAKSYEELIAKDLSADIFRWVEMIRQEIFKNYGIYVSKIVVVSVDPADKRYAQATQDKIVAEKEGEGRVVTADFDSTVMSEKTSGMAIKSLARASNKGEEFFKNLRDDDPEKFNRLYGAEYNMALENANRIIAMDKKAYYKIDSSGGSITSDTFSAVIAGNIATKNINSSSENKKNNEGESKKGNYTKEEVDDLLAFAKKHGKKK